MKEISWEKIRKDFAVTEKMAYFQSAGMSPIPRQVYKAIRNAYKTIYESGDIYWHTDLEKAEMLKRRIGRLINTPAHNLAFLPNSSLAFSMIALPMKNKWGQDLNIISMEEEFPATDVPFKYQDIMIQYVSPESGRYPVEKIMEKVDQGTRAVVCSHVQYASGYRQNLEELGKAVKEKGLKFIVNATQGFPFFPIDVKKMNIDAMAISLHKWGLAGHTGSLFFTTDEFRREYPAPLAGWLSVVPEEGEYILTGKEAPLSIQPNAMQYNFGTMNLQNIAGLERAMRYMEKIGFENIRKRILELTNQTVAGLNQIQEMEIHSPRQTPEEQSAILSINLAGKNNQECVTFLENHGVITTIRDQKIRISLNIFNNQEDIDRLVEGIKEFCEQPGTETL